MLNLHASTCSARRNYLTNIHVCTQNSYIKDSSLFVAAVVGGLVSLQISPYSRSLKSQGGLTHGRGMSKSG